MTMVRKSIQIVADRMVGELRTGRFGGAETCDMLNLIDHATGSSITPPQVRRNRDEILGRMRARVANGYYRAPVRGDVQALIAVL